MNKMALREKNWLARGLRCSGLRRANLMIFLAITHNKIGHAKVAAGC
jgi:hypothetical protein